MRRGLVVSTGCCFRSTCRCGCKGDMRLDRRKRMKSCGEEDALQSISMEARREPPPEFLAGARSGVLLEEERPSPISDHQPVVSLPAGCL
jgi:hypothetical protein